MADMHLQFEQMIPMPRAAVYAFHEDPGHLELLHRGWCAFRMIQHEERVRAGGRLWFEVTAVGILPVALGFEHSLYEPGCRFGERLIHGPFRRFEHVHEFEDRDGATLVRDCLEVELPLYYGGEVMMKLLVGPMLRRAFAMRNAALLALAESGALSQRAGQKKGAESWQ